MLFRSELARRLEGEGRFAVLPVRVPPVFGPNCALTLRETRTTPAVTAFLESLTQAVG